MKRGLRIKKHLDAIHDVKTRLWIYQFISASSLRTYLFTPFLILTLLFFIVAIVLFIVFKVQKKQNVIMIDPNLPVPLPISPPKPSPTGGDVIVPDFVPNETYSLEEVVTMVLWASGFVLLISLMVIFLFRKSLSKDLSKTRSVVIELRRLNTDLRKDIADARQSLEISQKRNKELSDSVKTISEFDREENLLTFAEDIVKSNERELGLRTQLSEKETQNSSLREQVNALEKKLNESESGITLLLKHLGELSAIAKKELLVNSTSLALNEAQKKIIDLEKRNSVLSKMLDDNKVIDRMSGAYNFAN